MDAMHGHGPAWGQEQGMAPTTPSGFPAVSLKQESLSTRTQPLAAAAFNSFGARPAEGGGALAGKAPGTEHRRIEFIGCALGSQNRGSSRSGSALNLHPTHPTLPG